MLNENNNGQILIPEKKMFSYFFFICHLATVDRISIPFRYGITSISQKEKYILKIHSSLFPTETHPTGTVPLCA